MQRYIKNIKQQENILKNLTIYIKKHYLSTCSLGQFTKNSLSVARVKAV